MLPALRRVRTLCAAGFSLVLLSSFIALPASAQVGAAAVSFLQIEPDSRSAAMGNTSVALAEDANAVFWNPAGLAFQKGVEGSITHSQWLPAFKSDLFFDYLAAKYHVEGLGTFGAHVTFFNLGENEARDEF
ncbi:MAG: PorV/PorQ family protein, partial [Bacteroidota bacterium]